MSEQTECGHHEDCRVCGEVVVAVQERIENLEMHRRQWRNIAFYQDGVMRDVAAALDAMGSEERWNMGVPQVVRDLCRHQAARLHEARSCDAPKDTPTPDPVSP